MPDSEREWNGSEIAVVGYAGRFPGAKNVDEFWRNLCDGVEAISSLSDDEIEAAGIDPDLVKDANYVKSAFLLEGADLFDAAFFGYTPREAEVMDPQHRVFLECAWEALEHAGYNPETARMKIGVYAGAKTNYYLVNNIFGSPEALRSLDMTEVTVGNDLANLSTRVSYKFGLTGPSYSLHTACSTSLVAVHLACQSLLIDECRMALAGGVAISVPQKAGYLYKIGSLVSPDGHCRAFDDKAQGINFGSGVGVVVLKRLADALDEGDTIYAVIKGSATNNDGALKASFTAPGVDGQMDVILEALANAQVKPQSISYIEAHGTGTSLGDSIEARALAKAFRQHGHVTREQCAIGSVKTNVGHLSEASGISGFIKTVLMLERGQIPPSLHFERLNAKIDFSGSPFYVNTKLSEWKSDGRPRRAGINSFGFGSTNAHIILEEAPPRQPPGPSRPWQLLSISARSESALETATDNLILALKRDPDAAMADVAYTLHVGRKAFNHRRTLVCRDAQDAVDALEARDAHRVFAAVQDIKDQPVIFMFSGLGDHYPGMGRELYHTEPVFRESIDACADILQPVLDLDLREVLNPAAEPASAAVAARPQLDLRKMLRRNEDVDETARRLNQPSLAHPALFATEYALARLWISWGIQPRAMIGNSLGEFTAACLSGVLTLKDALGLVTRRAQLIQSLPESAMLAVPLSESEVRPFLNGHVSLAIVSGPLMCVVAGAKEHVAELETQLAKRGAICRYLQTSHALHTGMMEPIAAEFRQIVEAIPLHAPQIPYVSDVTGTWITAEQATDAGYWTKHLCQTMRLADGFAELWKMPDRILLEIGPGAAMCTLALQNSNDGRAAEQSAVPSLRYEYDRQSDVAFLLNALGKLWLAGVSVDWAAFYANERRYRVPLPTAPFERQRYWIEPRPRAYGATTPVEAQVIRKGKDVSGWFYSPRWTQAVLSNRANDNAAERSPYLVFATDDEFGAEFVRRLEQAGHRVTTVRAGGEFRQTSENRYTIDPKRSGDYAALLHELRQEGKYPRTVVHLWSAAEADHQPTGEAFAAAQQVGFYSLLYLTQALGSQGGTDPVRIDMISSGIQDVSGDEPLLPERATILGLCKVIPQEAPLITCRSIDVTRPQAGSRQEVRLVEQLIAEASAPATDRTVAYRGLHRWVQGFEPVRLESSEVRTPPVREGGVYLITGGLGGMGLVLAHHLAQNFRAKLALVGRSGLPDRESWADWLAAHAEDDPMSIRIRRMQALEAIGADVMIVRADASDRAQMQAAIARTEERFGALNGVIHAAGLLGRSLMRTIQESGESDSQAQFQSKVHGLLVLDGLLRGKSLDFCLLTSSISTVLGGLGLGAYASANAFMDVFAHRQNRTASFRWVCMDSDEWQLEKKKDKADDNLGASLLELSMTPEEGVEAVRRILAAEALFHVVLSTSNLQARIERWINLDALKSTGRAEETRPAAQASSSSQRERPALKKEYAAPRSAAENDLCEIWQELFSLERVGIHDNFFELGGNSILLIQAIYRAGQAGIQVTPQQMFDHPTVAELVELSGAS